MKKIFLIFTITILFVGTAFAEDCMHDPVYERDWNAEVTTGMRVRDIPCMENSIVLTTVPVGEVVKVIAETDGYYKVRLKDGTEGWSGQWLMQSTSKPFNEDLPPESLYDVVGHIYEPAVRYLKENNIVVGYSDGSFQPDKTINRAEFTKIIVESTFSETEINSCIFEFEKGFSDVKQGDWFYPYICLARNKGVVAGYQDGSFQPSKQINLVEAAKIISLAFQYDYTENSIWYKPFLDILSNKQAIPTSIATIKKKITRGEIAEMIYRLKSINADLKEYMFFQSGVLTEKGK